MIPADAQRTVSSLVGPLTLSVAGDRLVGLAFGPGPERDRANPVLAEASRQLDSYFRHERQAFDLPLAPPTEGFLARVLTALAQVPFGQTVSYKDLTLAAGLELERVRDVGAALGRNPLAIVLPCHRVVGSDGTLVGFGGGLERKRLLLDLESPQLQLSA